MMIRRLTLEIHVGGAWREAAVLAITDDALGIRSPTALDYDTGYFIDMASEDLADGRAVTDIRALSVRHPVDLAGARFDTWPPFLVDLLPQGQARRRLADELGYGEDDPKLAYPLLVRGGGSPIGNIRIGEAWTAEQARIAGIAVQGVSTEEIFERSPAFTFLADTFALVASGSSGVQGEWPKILMTQAEDGLWYPDPVVEDARARAHAIVKMSRARFAEDRAILAAEAPYLEVARDFGLRVGAPLTHRRDTLLIPRFDRRVGASGVTRLGQESIVSASGIAAFGHLGSHESYIATLAASCSEPAAEIVEYVLRDVLARAMGDTDNHGRNTALQKHPDGRIALTPLFDFAPMTLDPGVIAPSTTWACLRGTGGGLDYRRVAEATAVAASDAALAGTLTAALAAKADFVERVPDIARNRGVEAATVDRACRYSGEVAGALRSLTS